MFETSLALTTVWSAVEPFAFLAVNRLNSLTPDRYSFLNIAAMILVTGFCAGFNCSASFPRSLLRISLPHDNWIGLASEAAFARFRNPSNFRTVVPIELARAWSELSISAIFQPEASDRTSINCSASPSELIFAARQLSAPGLFTNPPRFHILFISDSI